jgi:hypothetical protein
MIFRNSTKCKLHVTMNFMMAALFQVLDLLELQYKIIVAQNLNS